ncbi:hypothetical protein [Cohnella abietis]|uniref:Uncharacterized protein n=1 Tax=Cohnella abietis TaxID=2507935 RepID=A0A3T1D056_9BACL|nr:hypothetical protein [Cohnella abietis]BBI31480.1 hypothetical protein KCTCHS21_08790 [Cohnella abietis]
MKKLFISLFILVFLVVIAGVGALYYIKPDRDMDLYYQNVPLNKRALDMVKHLSPELILTEADIINLAKKSIADNPQVEKDVLVTGASFTLDREFLISDLNIIWKNRVSAGIQVTYRLHWESPNVIATAEKATMKGITLPTSMFSERIIPIGNELPKILKIKELVWGDGEVKVLFKKPTFKDLQELIG